MNRAPESDTFGQECQFMILAIEGDVEPAAGRSLVAAIVENLNMTPAHEPIFYAYPFFVPSYVPVKQRNTTIVGERELEMTERGGEGYTYIQPITESYIALDAWPRWKGAHLVISSCVPFPLETVFRTLRQNGYFILNHNMHISRLAHEAPVPELVYPSD